MAYVGFKKLVQKIAHKKHPPTDVKAVASVIARKKYGQKRLAKMAIAGKKKAARKKS